MTGYQAILFDLDGTLCDTAADLAAALNRLRIEDGQAPLPLDTIRPAVSQGSVAMLRIGFGLAPDDPAIAALRPRFLDHYLANLCTHTRLFDGFDEVLAHIERNGQRWGIITNKPAFLTDPLVAALQLNQRAAVVVSGDTTPHAKPHPAPMQYALQKLQLQASDCLYIGDAERDIAAARAVNMPNRAALWGYLEADDPPSGWQADGLLENPRDLLALL